MSGLAEALNFDIATPTVITWTLVTLVVVLVLRRAARQIVSPNVDDPEGIYGAGKIINYLATVIFLITVAFIWVDAFDERP